VFRILRPEIIIVCSLITSLIKIKHLLQNKNIIFNKYNMDSHRLHKCYNYKQKISYLYRVVQF